MKRFLLDTCVISDARARSNPGLTDWLENALSEHLYLSVITVGEIAWGIERLPNGKKRTVLERWLSDDLHAEFRDRILSVNAEIVMTWGRLRAMSERRGNKADPLDALIAATAVHHDLILVTRNEKDFLGTGAPIFNPWSA